jgi:hypothetical protein
MTPKEKRDRKNANHRRNEKRRGRMKTIRMFGVGKLLTARLLADAKRRRYE